MKKILSLLLAMCSIASVSDALTWGSPTTISTANVNATNPQVVIDSNGNVTAAWVENNAVKSSYQPANGNWGAAVQLSTVGQTASSPTIGVDGNGNVTAVWIQNGQVATSLFNGTSWSAPATLSAIGSTEVALAVDSTGNAVAVWANSGLIETATYKFASKLWGLVSTLISTGTSSHPAVSIGADGTVCALWHFVPLLSTSDEIMFTTSTVGGTWLTSSTAASGTLGYNYPTVIVDANGNSTALFWEYTVSGGVYSGVSLVSSYLPSGASSFGSLNYIVSGGVVNPANLVARLCVDGYGNLAALWSQCYDGATYFIQNATSKGGGSWTVYEFTEQDQFSYAGDIAVNSVGNLVGCYMQSSGPNSTMVTADEANTASVFSEIWVSGATVSQGTPNGFPRCAATLTGGTTLNAAAVWLTFNGSNNVIQAATGSRPIVLAPTNLSVNQSSSNFQIYTQFDNLFSWQASSSPNIVEYNIYRNGTYLTSVTADILSYTDGNATQNGHVVYGVAAIDVDSNQSPVTSITFN